MITLTKSVRPVYTYDLIVVACLNSMFSMILSEIYVNISGVINTTDMMNISIIRIHFFKKLKFSSLLIAFQIKSD